MKKINKLLSLFVMLIIFVVGVSVTAIVTYAEDYFTIRIEYRFENGDTAHDSYVAVFPGGTDIDITVTNPVLPGYKAVESTEDGAASALTTRLDFEVTHNENITVYYIPDLVHYRVSYFKQNIRDDQYSEDFALSSDYYERTGYTGEYPEELENLEFEGFTSLFHEPDVIAADGSTVFRLYFDRNYYLINFNLNGGYGVEPVYAKYGSTYNIAVPERKGYVFKGWARTDGQGNYLDSAGNPISKAEAEDAAVRFTSSTVPAENMFYDAVWIEGDSKYSIIYWIENANDDGYSVVGAKDITNVTSGTEVTYEDIVNNYDFFSLNLSSEFPSMSQDQITEFKGMGRYFELNEAETLSYENQFEDGKFTVNGSGTSRISLFYSRREITQRFFYARKTDAGQVQVAGSTKAFSSGVGTFDEHLSSSCGGGNTPWQHITDTVPQIADKYSGLIEQKEYYSDYNSATYYYFEFSTKYYSNMRDHWLIDALDPLLVKYQKEGDNDYAHFGAWSVEWGTPYARKANKTVKGIYEKLDKQLLYEEKYITDNGVDPLVLNYLAFWTNAKQESWNRKANIFNFTYLNYTELLPGEYDASGNWNGTGGYLDVYKNDYTGKIYGLLPQNRVETYDAGGKYASDKPNRDKYVKNEQTAAALEGFTLMTDAQAEAAQFGANPKCDWYAKDIDGTHFDADHHCDIRYFYRRNFYNIQFINNNETDSTVANVFYGAPLSSYGYTPEYNNPPALAPYYDFGGWYYTPYHFRQVDFSTATMADGDMTFYAKWVPVERTVNFYADYNKLQENVPVHSCVVNYNETILTNDIPTTNEGSTYTISPPSVGATFTGWYYFNETGNKVRFDPDAQAVTRDMNLYAEWISSKTARYRATFVERGTGNPVADPETGTAFVAKTKTFQAKSGDSLDENHKWVEGQPNWWPVYSSHSILIDPNTDAYGYEPNTYAFEYIKKAKVWYQVKYLDSVTGAELQETKVVNTSMAAVTESSDYIVGYIADRVTKALTLAASPNADEALAKQEELEQNTIYFYYTANTTEALYQVNHMIENTDCTDPNDKSQYSLYMNETLTVSLNSTLDFSELFNGAIATNLQSSGFEIDTDMTTVEGGVDQNPVADGNKLIISIYYKRLTYGYTVKYVHYEQEKLYDAEMQKPEEERDPTVSNGVLYTESHFDDGEKLPMGTEVKLNPEKFYTKDGVDYRRISDRELSLVIRPFEENNIITVYYTTDTSVELKYEAVSLNNADDDFAMLTLSHEIVSDSSSIAGSTVILNDEFASDYIFLGWYSDNKAQGVKFTEELNFRPDMSLDDTTYYAVFEPIIHASVSYKYTIDGVNWLTEPAVEGLTAKFADTDDVSKVLNYGDSVSLYANATEESLFRFVGWYANDEGDALSGSSVDDTPDRNTRYVARFKKLGTDYKITFNFNTRANGEQSYVVKGKLEGEEIEKNKDGLTSEFVMSKAPYEKIFGETFKWLDSSIVTSFDTDGTLLATVSAEQNKKKVFLTYKENPDAVTKTIQVERGATCDSDSSGQLERVVAKEDWNGVKFSYWMVKRLDGSEVTKCYYPEFNLAVYDDYVITPVYEGVKHSVDETQTSVSFDLLDYSRNQWTDSEGNKDAATDKLYADFEITYKYKGQELGTLSGFKQGVIFEMCAKLADGEEFDSAACSYASDTEALKTALAANKNKSSMVYNWSGEKRRSVLISNIPKVSNKNRVEYAKAFNNNEETGAYGRYVMKAYGYMIDSDGNVTLSQPIYVCLSEEAAKTYTAIN